MEKSVDEISNHLATQLLNNLSLILIGLNRNTEALSLFNEAIIERNSCTYIYLCVFKIIWYLLIRTVKNCIKHLIRIYIAVFIKLVSKQCNP